MDRRRFLCQVGLATAAGAATGREPASVAAPRDAHDNKPGTRETRRVTYAVKGFTCITCAVGLEVMLRGVTGVARADASYPANEVVIGFDEHVTNEQALKAFITACGFSAV